MKVCRCPNNGHFIIALILLIIFLLIELFLRIYNLYFHEPLVDVPSHFFAGMAIGAGVMWILALNEIRHKKLWTVFFTFVVAIVWEILETLEELIIPNPPYLQDIFFWDGFFDIVITVIGGIASLSFLYMIARTTKLLDDQLIKISK